ncbi:MAG TPA: GlcNAc-transferase family protein [Rickettsiales bacterium]|nr:GlcNAc-transferase family protein [Rickettsiales bacterium]
MGEYTTEDTIFVQIASYRDPELQWTLKDLFEKVKKGKQY